MNGVLLAFRADGFEVDDVLDHDLEGASSFVTRLDLDKAWQALSVLTTPASGPLSDPWAVDPLDPVLGGQELTDEDWGYGPPRHLAPEQVRQVAGWLAALTDDEARRRFDPAAFGAASIYPFVWDEDPDELWAGELQPGVRALRGFYADAAAAGHHVVLLLE